MVLLFINAVYLSKKCSVIHEIKVIDIAILTWAFGRNSRPYDLQPYKFKIDYWQSFISTACTGYALQCYEKSKFMLIHVITWIIQLIFIMS